MKMSCGKELISTLLLSELRVSWPSRCNQGAPEPEVEPKTEPTTVPVEPDLEPNTVPFRPAVPEPDVAPCERPDTTCPVHR